MFPFWFDALERMYTGLFLFENTLDGGVEGGEVGGQGVGHIGVIVIIDQHGALRLGALGKVIRGQRRLREAVDGLGLSARAHDKVLKLARTIADLDCKEDISSTHLAEAIGYRALDRINT